MIADYADDDLRQHGLDERHSNDDLDPRSAFNHDRDRILYSRGFAALAGKTQVVASEESGGYHTRLTHTLKVEQVGRRITEMLNARTTRPGPDPDLVSAACLAHDVGHPPFGHAGEDALRDTYCDLDKPAAAAGGAPDPPAEESSEIGDASSDISDNSSHISDAFEGNAQNLRILIYLESRKTQLHRGLHLTRATLDASTKYPWYREAKPSSGPGPDRSRKFGLYRLDPTVAEWLYRGELPDTRPVEEQIMDWADDVTFACHDVEDFYRAGLIPLGNLLDFRSGPWSRLPIEDQASPELARFLDHVEKKWGDENKQFSREQAVQTLQKLSDIIRPVVPYLGLQNDKRLLNSAVSGLIRYFLEGLRYDPVDPENATGGLHGYNANLHIPEDRRFACNLLKELIWFYVIHNPALASQQSGSRRIVRELLTWHAKEPEHLLPPDRQEEVAEHGSVLRGCCDHIASLTERQAGLLHRRMSGVSPGSITDRLFS